jgi:hypothetical protein
MLKLNVQIKHVNVNAQNHAELIVQKAVKVNAQIKSAKVNAKKTLAYKSKFTDADGDLNYNMFFMTFLTTTLKRFLTFSLNGWTSLLVACSCFAKHGQHVVYAVGLLP